MTHTQPEASTSSSVHVKPWDASMDAPPTAAQKVDAVEEHSDDELLDELELELENDFDLGGFRERRMEEIRLQMAKVNAMKESHYGKYTEFKIEKDIIQTTAKAKRSVIHFFHRDFRRCKIMDAHLEKLAAKHFDTLFIKAEVSNVPFLVTKMEVKVLPCVVGFVDGVSKMKIVGFDELEGGDDFSTASLELTLKQCGVVGPAGSGAANGLPPQLGFSAPKRPPRGGIRSGNARGGDDGSDLDDY